MLLLLNVSMRILELIVLYIYIYMCIQKAFLLPNVHSRASCQRNWDSLAFFVSFSNSLVLEPLCVCHIRTRFLLTFCYYYGIGKFWISKNRFSGTVPSEMGALKELEIFQLYDNTAMVGRMPPAVCKLVVPSSVGGNLSSLIADCEFNCTCCTSCM